MVVLAVVVATATVACGGDGDSSVSSRDSGGTATTGAQGAHAYVGLSKKAAIGKAENDGHRWRVGREDDESFPATLDYNPDRVTFEIDDGEVTQASFG